jgi:hypothetical protein
MAYGVPGIAFLAFGTTVVAPLSREYPIETVFFESQEAVAAIRLNGEVTWDPFTGTVTVMADTVAVLASNARMAQKVRFIVDPQIMLSECAFAWAEGADFDALMTACPREAGSVSVRFQYDLPRTRPGKLRKVFCQPANFIRR